MNRLALLLSLLSTSACQAPKGQEWRSTAGFATTVFDNYNAEISALGYVAEGDVDYSMTELAIGSTRITPDGTKPIKHEFVGITLGKGSVDNLDIIEISAGGNHYFDKGEEITPFVSIYTTVTDPDLNGFTSQLGFRIGGGIDVAISPKASFTFGADYLIPLIDSEDSTGIVHLNLGGLAIRIGMAFVL